MARIRTVKPEFWDSEAVGLASLRARLLYIAMWNWADDYGIGDATPIRLIGFAFPNDELGVSDFPPLREEISERFGVVFYKHEGRPYYYIPSWEKHQRTEKRAKQRIPFPHDIENVEMTDVSVTVADFPTPSSGNADAGTGEQGKKEEGTGEQGKGIALRATVPAKTDEDFEVFWNTYGKKIGKGAAEKAWAKAIKRVTPAELITAAAEHAAWHRRAATETRFIPNASTWLNEKRWADERPDPATLTRDPKQAATNDLFDAAMQRAIERERNAS